MFRIFEGDSDGAVSVVPTGNPLKSSQKKM